MRRLHPLYPALAIALAACGDDAPSGPPPPPPAAAATTPAAAPALPAPSPDSGRATLLDEVRKRPFKNEDFIENEFNRDPFRSFLSDFAGGQAQTTQYKILLPRNSLEELKLIAIVGPPTRDVGGKSVISRGEERNYAQPRAMFLDPSGMGIPVVRGDHLSKADAKVIRIDPEKSKVFVEMKEDLGGGKLTTVERAIELHQGEGPAGPRP